MLVHFAIMSCLYTCINQDWGYYKKHFLCKSTIISPKIYLQIDYHLVRFLNLTYCDHFASCHTSSVLDSVTAPGWAFLTVLFLVPIFLVNLFHHNTACYGVKFPCNKTAWYNMSVRLEKTNKQTLYLDKSQYTLGATQVHTQFCNPNRKLLASRYAEN